MAGRLQLRGAGSGSASPRSPGTLTPGPLPPGWQGREERWLWRAGGATPGEFPRRGSPGILFARLKGSPPWFPFLEPGGDYCLASAGSAADGRVGGGE